MQDEIQKEATAKALNVSPVADRRRAPRLILHECHCVLQLSGSGRERCGESWNMEKRQTHADD